MIPAPFRRPEPDLLSATYSKIYFDGGRAFYPGSNPGDDRHGTAATFEAARAAFEAAWHDYLPNLSDADFQAWRDQEAWTAEKYRRFDRHERMPPVLTGDG